MGYRQVIIARKDLNMGPGKLAAQVAHASNAYFLNLTRNNIRKYYNNAYRCREEDGRQSLYMKDSINFFAKKYYDLGKDFFYLNIVGYNDNGFPIYEDTDTPDAHYEVKYNLDKEIYEEWITSNMTKTVCEAKNKNHLLKAKSIADELGLVENKDYFCIYDKCFTDLTPEEDGVVLTCIGFRPLQDEIAWKISKKYQLYT